MSSPQYNAKTIIRECDSNPKPDTLRALGIGYHQGIPHVHHSCMLYFFHNPVLHKLVEAQAVAKITQDVVVKFVYRSIICRFKVTQHIITGNGAQFTRGKFLCLHGTWAYAYISLLSINYREMDRSKSSTNPSSKA